MDINKYENDSQIFLSETVLKRTEFKNNFYKRIILDEDTSSTLFDSHYIYHIAWASRKIFEINPNLHVDFSSSLNFCTTISAYRKVKFYDYRPVNLKLSNLECDYCDLSSEDFSVGKYKSVSCMHVVEHIGLGRYGDPLDSMGDIKAIENLKKSVTPGGDLLFVVPCGRPSIHFNAHRIYSAKSIVDYFGKNFTLIEFYFITGIDNQPPISNPDLNITNNFDYGCGCFHFKCN